MLKLRLALSATMILLLFTSLPAFSQSDATKYFDDGGISNRKKIIKLGFDPLNGEKLITFEKHIFDNGSFEYGLGVVDIGTQFRLFNKPDSERPIQIDSTGLGYTATIALKVYSEGFLSHFYICIQPKITVMSGNFLASFGPQFGYQYLIKNRVTISAETGGSVRFYKPYKYTSGINSYTNQDKNITFGFYFPILIKAGILF